MVIGLRLWGPLMIHLTVNIYCNNDAVVRVLGNSKTKNACITVCIHNILLTCAHYDLYLNISHTKGKDHVIADFLSRLYILIPI